MGDVLSINSAGLKSKKDFALAYAAIGWHVLPVWWVVKKSDGYGCGCGKPECKNPGKHPWSKAGQNDATTDGDIIKRWWDQYPQLNIGIFLAPSNLVAVDIDPRNGGHETIEMLEDQHGHLYSDVMSFTGGGGEHRVFTLPQGLQNLPGKLGKGVDLKLNGFIVAEPSSHVSGKTYEWEASSNPLDGESASPLPDWIRDLAFSRPQTSLESSDSFLSRYVTEGQVEDLRSALLFIDADDRETWIKVGTALKTIGAAGWNLFLEYSQRSDKFDAADLRRVWHSFKPHSLSYESVFYMAQAVGWVNMPNATPAIDLSAIVAKPTIQDDRKNQPTSFPVPVLNELVEWMETFEELPTRSISMQGALALVAVLSGRIYKSSNSNDSSLYLMTLADTGKGKGYPAKGIKSLLTHAGFSSLIKGAGNTSASAVFAALRESPCHIQISDEIGKQYATARKQSNGQLAEAFAQLTNAYSETDTTMLPRNFSTESLTQAQITARGNRYVVHPSITLFSFATLEQVFNNLSSSDIDDGFLNRQIVVHADDEPLPERDREFSMPSETLIEWIKSIRQRPIIGSDMAGMDTAYDQQPLPVLVKISDEAKALFKAFKSEARAYEGDRLKLAIRWNENAMRMSTGMGVAADPSNPIVSATIAQWCIDYVRYHGLRFFELVETHIADNDVHRLRNQVLNAIDKAGANGRSYGQLADFCRMWKGASLLQRDGVLESLKREGLIIEAMPKAKAGRGRKPVHAIYFHRQHITLDDAGLSDE